MSWYFSRESQGFVYYHMHHVILLSARELMHSICTIYNVYHKTPCHNIKCLFFTTYTKVISSSANIQCLAQTPCHKVFHQSSVYHSLSLQLHFITVVFSGVAFKHLKDLFLCLSSLSLELCHGIFHERVKELLITTSIMSYCFPLES